MSTRAIPSYFRPVLIWLATFPMGWGCVVRSNAFSAQAKADNPATVLASMRQAVGRPVLSGRATELVMEGTVDRSGLTTNFSLRFAQAGMFVEMLTPPLPGRLGFNGNVCWSTDFSGMPERLELHDLDRNRLWIGMRTGLWVSNVDAQAVTLSKTSDQRDEVAIEIKQGRFKARVHVSSATWLPTALDASGVAGPERWTFADYRPFAGLNVPGKVTRKQAGQTETYRVVAIRLAPEAPAGVYDPITARPDDARFNEGAPADVALKPAMTGQVLVRPTVDGRDIGCFIIDTGAGSNTLDPKAMAKLKLKPIGTAGVTSVRGNEQSSIVQATSIALGPMTIANPFFVTMQLGYVRDALGEDVFGIIGHDLLSRCVAEITLADDSIKLFDPKTYRLGSGSWQPLTFNESVPVIEGKFEGGRKGLFRIDTGGRTRWRRQRRLPRTRRE